MCHTGYCPKEKGLFGEICTVKKGEPLPVECIDYEIEEDEEDERD